jgi:SAM-dependent methyltransferase
MASVEVMNRSGVARNSLRVVPALLDLPKPARRSTLSTLAWAVEAPLARLVSHGPPPGHFRLNLGCGEVFAAGWLNADFATLRWTVQRRRWPDWTFDATRRWPCPDDYFEAIHCEHVLEHFDYDTAIEVVVECRRTLRPGGVLRLSVPDVSRFVEAYCRLRDGQRPADGFARFGSGAAGISRLTQCDGHLSVWDARTLISVLRELDFSRVDERSFGVSALPQTIDRSDRAWESCYVEAVK